MNYDEAIATLGQVFHTLPVHEGEPGTVGQFRIPARVNPPPMYRPFPAPQLRPAAAQLPATPPPVSTMPAPGTTSRFIYVYLWRETTIFDLGACQGWTTWRQVSAVRRLTGASDRVTELAPGMSVAYCEDHTCEPGIVLRVPLALMSEAARILGLSGNGC